MDRKSEFMEHFDDLLVCAICSGTYTSPKKLPCNHTFCLKCLEVYEKYGQLEGRVCCPLCRNETALRGNIQELPDNTLYLCLIDIKHSVRASLAKYDWGVCSVKSCKNSEEWHCMVCDGGFCNICVSHHMKSHQVVRLEAFRQECSALEISNQLKGLEKQLKEREKEFQVAVAVTEAAIGQRCEELKVLLDRHKEQLLHELKLQKVNHLKELNDLQKEIEDLLALPIAPTVRLATGSEQVAGNLKKQKSPLPLKLADFCATDLQFNPRNIHQELLSFGSLSNILGRITMTGQRELFCEAECSNLKRKIDSQIYTVRAKSGVIVGIAALGDMIYVVHSLASCVDAYDPTDFSLLDSSCLTISGLSNPQDMASCERFSCLYVTDSYDDSVYRIERTASMGKSKKWTMADQPLGVSVSSKTANVFVTCLYAQKLYEFSSSGDVLQCIVLHPDISHPHHALQVSSGKIVLSHGFWSTDPLHRLCVVDSHGRSSLQYGHQPGAATGQLNQPVHLATCKNGFVFVADSENSRIELLDSTLSSHLISITDSSDQMKSPHRICLDAHHGLLYAVENTLQNRIYVFNLSGILG